MLIYVKMQMIVGILTFMSRINFMFSWIEHKNLNIISGPGKRTTLLQSQVNNKQQYWMHMTWSQQRPLAAGTFFRSNTLRSYEKWNFWDPERFEKMESKEFILKMAFHGTPAFVAAYVKCVTKCNPNLNSKQYLCIFVRDLKQHVLRICLIFKNLLSMVILHVNIAFQDASLCRPADNISRQFVHRSGPPIHLYILSQTQYKFIGSEILYKLSLCSWHAQFCFLCSYYTVYGAENIVRMRWLNCVFIVLFVWFDSLRPINNLSVKQGRVCLGWTSTKLG